MTTLKPPNKNQVFRFLLSADKEAKRDATFFIKVREGRCGGGGGSEFKHVFH
jgi:hypothetical protein